MFKPKNKASFFRQIKSGPLANMKCKVSLRRFPYPYQAALSICSDIDGTNTNRRFLSIQEFLNTQYETSMGPGIGLEIGNSFFPYTPDDSFAYFSSKKADREIIELLIKTGYIDCIHSYGDGARTRDDALRALEQLAKSDCKLDVWIDHSKAPSNFGKDTTAGFGDVIGSEIYHADATLAYGIKFVWMGRGSNIIGHGIPFSLKAFKQIFDRNHVRESIINIGKELAKTTLAYGGNRRFAIHRNNQLLRVATLQDSQEIYEFNRCNNYWKGLSYGHDIFGLAYVIRKKALDDLINNQGYMIIYTHLGVGPNTSPFIPKETQKALLHLARTYNSGLIYVTTTSRILNYHLNHRYLQWSVDEGLADRTQITIHGIDDPIFGFRQPNIEELQGITFYVPDRHKVEVYLGEKKLKSIERNPADYTGKESVMILRTFLNYPLPVQNKPI